MSMATNNSYAAVRRPRRSRPRLAATGILAGCVLYVVVSSILDEVSYNAANHGHGRDIAAGQRFLRSEDGVVTIGDEPGLEFESVTQRLQTLIDRIKSRSSSSATSNRAVKAKVVARGPGPELMGPSGQAFRFDGEIKKEGVRWYKVLASPKLQWNLSPYRWNSCPEGEDMFLGDMGLAFHEPDPRDSSKSKSKRLRFRILRRDERECLWNYSKSCLAGGSFVMNFGKNAKDMLYPGDYTLKTADGAIRVVAYNTNRACSRRPHDSAEGGRGDIVVAPRNAQKDAPIDYLRRAKMSTVDPEGCEAWMRERESNGDLFSYNSDLATIHVDTPWMQVIIQVRQNKVATEDTCAFASMDIWIADIDSGLLEDEFTGVLGGNQWLTSPEDNGRVVKSRTLRRTETEENEVGGPFAYGLGEKKTGPKQ